MCQFHFNLLIFIFRMCFNIAKCFVLFPYWIVVCRKPCQNGGVCAGNNRCTCPDGYRGRWCHKIKKYRKCPTCLNGGKCRKRRCRCQKGFTGSRCEKRWIFQILLYLHYSILFSWPFTSTQSPCCLSNKLFENINENLYNLTMML